MSKHTRKKKNDDSNVKTCTLYVDGMHCASCEILIEKKLLKQKGIESVDASLKGNRVEINYLGEQAPDAKSLNKDFSKFGYHFSTKKIKHENSPLIQFKNGKMLLNKSKAKYTLKIGAVFVSLLIAFVIFEKLQLGQHVNVNANSSLFGFFLLGLVAGLSSCAALIGGLLLSMIKQWNEIYIASDSNFVKAQPHIMFHVGRLISFFVLGGVLGLIGSALTLDNTTIFSILTIVVSVVMLVLALQMLGVGWAQRLKFTAPKSFTRYVAEESNFRGRYMPFSVGALTFFLPCGFTLIAQTVALTSGSPIKGALIMLAFALGTLPILLGISFGGLAFNSRPSLTAKFNIIAGLLIIFFVIYNINGQLNVLGLPSFSDINLSSPQTEPADTAIVDENGVQNLKFVAKGFEYIPQGSTTIKADTETTLVVDNQGIQGCGTFMAARGLIDGYIPLKAGMNTVDLGKPAKGVYKLTCSMGMVPPVTITVI